MNARLFSDICRSTTKEKIKAQQSAGAIKLKGNPQRKLKSNGCGKSKFPHTDAAVTYASVVPRNCLDNLD